MKIMTARREPAAVLVFAVLLLAAGVFVLAGIAQLAATQAVIGQNEWESLGRRVRLENSRAMARQFVLQRMFSTTITNVAFTNASGFGGFALSETTVTNGDYWTTLSTTNTNVNLKINPFTLMERGGFYRVVIPGTITDGVKDIPWNFQVRTRSPITAGYPVVQHKPASNSVLALAGTSPYIDMNEPEQIVGFHEMARMRISSVTNTNVIFGSNQDTNGYVGFFDVPIGIAAYGMFTNAVPQPLGAGLTQLQMVLDLGSADPNDLNQVLQYVVPTTSDYTDTNTMTTYTGLPVRAVKLIGSQVYGLKPLQVVVPVTQTNLQTLYLSGQNTDANRIRRPIYFNFQRSEASGGTLNVVATNATGRWCIGISATHGNISFNTTGIVVVGGVRTDGTVSGSPVLAREMDPGGLDYIADRMMWLEDYKTP